MPSTGNSQLIKQNHYSESSNQEVFVFRGFMTLSLLVPWLCASWLSLTQTQSFQVGCWVHWSPLSAECTGVHSVTWVPSPFWGSLNHWHCQCPCIFKAEHGGKRSLVGCSPWGREESDTPEQLPFHFSLSCTGEGNGNPLQCSCLENPRDRGAWWAAVYGVTQSWTRLKWQQGDGGKSETLWTEFIFFLLCSNNILNPPLYNIYMTLTYICLPIYLSHWPMNSTEIWILCL